MPSPALILTPWGKGTPFEPTTALIDTLEKVHGFDRITIGGTCVDRARSWLASKALQTEHEWWLWCDDDNGHSVPRVLGLVQTAKELDLDFLAAIIPCRAKLPQPNCNKLGGGHFDGFGQAGKIAEIESGGLALAVMHRRVCQRIVDAGIDEVDFPGEPGIDPIVGWPFFMPFVFGRNYMSEDMAFCLRARFTGSRFWADTRMVGWHRSSYVLGFPDLMRAEEVTKLAEEQGQETPWI